FRFHAFDRLVEGTLERSAAAVDMDAVGVAPGRKLRIVGDEERRSARLHEGNEALGDLFGARLVARRQLQKHAGDVASIESSLDEGRKTRRLGQGRGEKIETRHLPSFVLSHSLLARSPFPLVGNRREMRRKRDLGSVGPGKSKPSSGKPGNRFLAWA